MVYACDECRFLFEKSYDDGRCPDCGKFAVRAATEEETREYENRKTEKVNIQKK